MQNRGDHNSGDVLDRKQLIRLGKNYIKFIIIKR
jgi:hypothetical protein